MIPNWTQQEYVSNILKIFNVLPAFNPATQTLTVNLFEKLKSKEPIDLSPYISNIEVNYVDFINNFAKRNLLSYQEVTFDYPLQYKIQNFFKYGQGNIEAANEHLEDSEDLIESDFANPQSYINPVFDMSMERLNIISMDTDDSTPCTTVTDNSGIARFRIDQDIFLEDDIVRISESTNPFYNGDWIVDTVVNETAPGAQDGYVELHGLSYDTIATATITKLNHKYAESDDVFILVQVPFLDVPEFSGHPNYRIEGNNFTFGSTAYFNLLDTGRIINDDCKQSLSFGEITHPLFYQLTLIETYWGLVGRMVNDPVKLFAAAHIPYNIFLKIDFLRPITIKTSESQRYYLNRVSDQASEKECVCELIKLP
jgi:hypothetical protein